MQDDLIGRESRPGLKAFLVIWFGQFISVIGSGLSAFALGVWVYQATGSATGFALIYLCSSLPAIVASPFSGMLIDYWNRRSAMILADAGAALSILAAAALLFAGSLKVWQICVVMAVLSVFTSAQLPAYSASATIFVPRRHLGRVGGLMQIGEATAQIIAPALGGVLTLAIGVKGVLLIDASTFLFAIITLLNVRLPNIAATAESASPQSLSLINVLYGWRYIQRTRGLLALMFFFAACNFFIGIISVLITPFILSTASPAALGTVLSTGGIGMLAGSLGLIIGTGPGRGIGMIFAIIGILMVLLVIVGRSYKDLRAINNEVSLLEMAEPVVCEEINSSNSAFPG